MKIPMPKDRERATLLRGLIQLETTISLASLQAETLIEPFLMGQIVEDISNRLRRKRPKTITTAWLQKTYRIGYARSARILDELMARGIIHKNPRR